LAICDTDKNRLDQLTQQLGILGVSNYRQLFGKIEAASIAVPTKLHYSVAREFLTKGIHVLVEKPFTTTLKEADSLIAVAKRNECILQVGHIERFNPAFSATQKLIDNPTFIECHRLSPFPNRSLDVGVVLDLMIHDIDIVLGLVNARLKKIEAVGVPVLTNFEDIANVRLNFQNGCVANLTASRISDEWMRKIRIFLRNAYVSLDYKNAEAFVYRKNGCEIIKTSLPIEKDQPLKRELAAFIKCVAANKEPLVSGAVGRQALAVALDIQKRIWKKLRAS
jgi:predicted dehydrogenase